MGVQWPAVKGVGMAAAMDAWIRINETLPIGAATVKQVVKQVVSGMLFSSPVQAVLPRGLLGTGALPAILSVLVEDAQGMPARSIPDPVHSI